MKNIVITGGAGFIGSHVVRLFVNKYPEYNIINLDKLTYAGNLANLKDVENKPYYKDYYLECKILMIDGHVYAIIGTGESRHVEQSFPENERPFYVLLSEEDQVTTFYRKKFYPDGSIEVRYAEFRRLSMIPNTKENKSDGYWTSRFPVRKVERIDKNTIDAVALELANGVLKESIESFKSGNL